MVSYTEQTVVTLMAQKFNSDTPVADCSDVAWRQHCREKKARHKHKTTVKAKLSAKVLVCDQCGDRFPGPIKFQSDGYVYCSQYCRDEGGWFDD